MKEISEGRITGRKTTLTINQSRWHQLSPQQIGNFWTHLFTYSIQIVIVSAWNPSQDPTGQLVDPHRYTGSPTSSGITLSHWHNNRKLHSNQKVKQHSLKYSFTQISRVSSLSTCTVHLREITKSQTIALSTGQQSSTGTGQNSEQVHYMHYLESSRSQSRLWTNPQFK